MERRYQCRNGVVERTRFCVGDRVLPRSGRRKGATSARDQERNLNYAARRLARLLNNNFSEDALLITLDYSASGLEKIMEKLTPRQQALIRATASPVGEIGEWKAAGKIRMQAVELGEELRIAMDAAIRAAEHQAKLYLRRIGRKIRHKAVWITADIDGSTGELVRIHHHIPLCPEAGQNVSWDLLRDQWKLGGVNIQRFYGRDYTAMANYLMRQVRHRPDAKKYSCSRGLEMPQPEERIVLAAHNEIRTPAGAQVLERQYNEEHVGQYVRYIVRKKERREMDGISKNQRDQR